MRSLTKLAAGALVFAGLLTIPGTAPAADGEMAEIVFSNGGRIVSIKADGSDRRVLSRKRAWVGQPWGVSDNSPMVSPDGQTILFNRYDDGFGKEIPTGLMAMNRDGSHIRRAFSPGEDAEILGYAWSADGSRIFVISFSDESPPDGENGTATTTLISTRADGTDQRVILTSTFVYSGEKVTGRKWLPYAVYPAPDGQRLLIESVNFFVGKPARLEWVDLRTGARSVFENDAGSASWSPDGAKIVFASGRDKLNFECYEGSCAGDPQLFIKEIGSGDVERLVTGKPQGANGTPVWSTDGQRIAFASTRTPGASDVGSEIWTIAPDGGCLTRLTNGAPDSASPQWMPGETAGECRGLAPEPLNEVTVGKWATEQKPHTLWAGPEFGGQLMSDTFLDGSDLGTAYLDCGSPDGDCRSQFVLGSAPVCNRNLTAALMSGRYLGMERRRVGLLIRGTSGSRIVMSAFYAGGLETTISTFGQGGGEKSGFGYHRQIVNRLRPVHRATPVAGSLGPAVLPWSVVRTSRVMVKQYQATGSLRKAAEKAKIFSDRGFVSVPYRRTGARAWLRFGRDLKRLGKIRSVKCKRWNNKPGTINIRSRFREMIK